MSKRQFMRRSLLRNHRKRVYEVMAGVAVDANVGSPILRGIWWRTGRLVMEQLKEEHHNSSQTTIT